MPRFPSDLESVSLKLLERINSPRALTVWLLIKHGEWRQLVQLRVDPMRYNSPLTYYEDCVPTDLFRKCQHLDTGIDTTLAALSAFHIAEKQCSMTNARLSRFVNFQGPFEDPVDERLFDFIDRVQNFVKDLLGKPPRSLDLKHGKGATFGAKAGRSTLPDKMSDRPTMTSPLSGFLPLWESTAWCRGLVTSHPYQSRPETVRGNRYVCVYKDATTGRGISIEASLNIAYQLPVGSLIKQRLLYFGIDLKDGQAIHQRIAAAASKDGSKATIDLTSASDTVATEAVKLFLLKTPEWYELLTTLRSPVTLLQKRDKKRKLPEKWQHLCKFSSMGNGFTFELETVMFLAITKVACDIYTELQTMYGPQKPFIIGVDILVYGDDIIAPTEVAQTILSALKFFGFTPNVRKTFTTGFFRESCGGDFFDGFSVRGHYVRELPSSPADWISLANGLKRIASQFESLGRINVTTSSWHRVLDCIPSKVRSCRGPAFLGDLVIHDKESTWSLVYREQKGWLRVWRPIGKKIPIERWHSGPQLASALYGVSSSGVSPRINGEDIVMGYRLGRISFG